MTHRTARVWRLRFGNSAQAFDCSGTLSVRSFRLAKKFRLHANFCTARKSVPVKADQTNQLVALVNGSNVVLRGGSAICSHAIRDERFHFRQ